MEFDFRQIFAPLGEHPSTSVNFTCALETRQLLSNVLAAGRVSVNFCQLSVLPGEILSTYVKFLCGQKTFCQLSMRLGGFPSIFVKFPCGREIFRQHSLTFRAAGRLSVNFHQLLCGQKTFCEPSMRPGDLPSTSLTFLCGQETFLQISSPFRAASRLSVNFRQPSSLTEELQSTFLMAGRPSDNFCQLSMRSRDFL